MSTSLKDKYHALECDNDEYKAFKQYEDKVRIMWEEEINFIYEKLKQYSSECCNASLEPISLDEVECSKCKRKYEFNNIT